MTAVSATKARDEQIAGDRVPEVRRPEEDGVAFGVQRRDEGLEWGERQL